MNQLKMVDVIDFEKKQFKKGISKKRIASKVKNVGSFHSLH